MQHPLSVWGLSPGVAAISVQPQFTWGGSVLVLGVRSVPNVLVPLSLCKWEPCKEREGCWALCSRRGQAGSGGGKALHSSETVSKDRGETPANQVCAAFSFQALIKLEVTSYSKPVEPVGKTRALDPHCTEFCLLLPMPCQLPSNGVCFLGASCSSHVQPQPCAAVTRPRFAEPGRSKRRRRRRRAMVPKGLNTGNRETAVVSSSRWQARSTLNPLLL